MCRLKCGQSFKGGVDAGDCRVLRHVYLEAIRIVHLREQPTEIYTEIDYPRDTERMDHACILTLAWTACIHSQSRMDSMHAFSHLHGQHAYILTLAWTACMRCHTCADKTIRSAYWVTDYAQ